MRAPGDQHVEPPAELSRPLLPYALTEQIALRDYRSHLRHVTHSNQSNAPE